MKLRYFDIERFGIWNNMRMDGLSDGLTVVYGPNGSGKTTLMQFVRAVFLGRPDESSTRYVPALHTGRQGGRIGVSHSNRESAVSRFWDVGRPGDEVGIGSQSDPSSSHLTLRQLLGEVDESIFTLLFTIGYREAEDFDLIVREALADNTTSMTASDELQTVERAIQEVADPAASLRDLTATRDRLRAEINRLSGQDFGPPRELLNVRAEVSRIEALIRELQERIQSLEGEIDRVRATPEARGVTPETAQPRVEELERRIRNWRNWQKDIEEQLAAVRNQIHFTALRDCDPIDRHPQAQMHRTRGSMTAIENQLSDLQGRLNEIRRSSASGQAVSSDMTLQGEIDTLRGRVFELCDRLGQHEVLDEIAGLEIEAEQLVRCRDEIERQLGIMLQRRRLLMHEFSNALPDNFATYSHQSLAACHAPSHDEYLKVETPIPQPVVNHDLERLVAELESLRQQLTDYRETLAQLNRRRAELEQLLTNTEDARRLQALRLDLNIVEEQLRQEIADRDVRHATRSILEDLRTDYQSRREPLVLAEASQYLRTLTENELVAIVPTADRRGVNIERADSSLVSLDGLSRGGRDQVAFSLRMAVARAYARRGARMPMILDDVFITSDSERAVAAAKLLREFAHDDQQVLFFTCHEHIADMFRQIGVTVRDLPQARAVTSPPVESRMPEQRSIPQPIMTPRRTAPTVVEPRSVAPVSPLSSSLVVKSFRGEAGEFPGELKDRTPIDRTPVVEPARPVLEPSANWIFYTELSTPIGELTGVTNEQADELSGLGVNTVEDLVAMVPDAAAIRMSHLGLAPEEIRMWQAQALLSCRVPMLRREDAELLVLCGINTPEKLSDSHPNEIFDRVSAFMRTIEGRRFVRERNPFDRQHAINWVRWAAHSRTLWHSRESTPRGVESLANTPPAPATFHTMISQTDNASRDANGGRDGNGNGTGNGSRSSRTGASSSSRLRTEITRKRGTTSKRSTSARSSGPMKRATSSRSSSTAARSSGSTSRSQGTRSKARVSGTKTTRTDGKQKPNEPKALRFYLEREAPVEDAPSIGPKTAQHLAAVGILTVRDLLDANAEVVAEELDNRRIKADTVRQWQAQATLVCCVPELRGHDAQILVAVEVETASLLSSYRPADLFALVAPFVETSEGQRIIRNGRKPDLDEVTYWIDCAKQSRSLRAA